MRTRVSNQLLPGVEVERVELTPTTRESETTTLYREDVYVDGRKIGQIRYLARRRSSSTEYGWVPVGGRSSTWSSKIDAIRRLFIMKGIER